MARKLNLKKGDKCIMAVVRGSRAARSFHTLNLNNIQEWSYEVEVITVGCKYITINWNGSEIKFEIDTNYYEKTSWGEADYQLFKDRNELKELMEKKEIFSKLKLSFAENSTEDFSLDQLRRIRDIVNEIKI